MSQSKEGEVLYRHTECVTCYGIGGWGGGGGPCDECNGRGFNYEPIPLSKLIEDSMPSEEEINKIFPITGSEDDLGSSEYIENELMRDGIKWLKTKLTNKK